MAAENKKKLILIKPNGNKSNRLIQNLHFELFCLEHHIDYHNPTFNDLASYYNQPCNSNTSLFLKVLQIDLLSKLFRHSKLIKRVFSVVWIFSKLGFLKLIRFDNTNEINSCEEKLLEAFRKSKEIYTAGFRFRLPHLAEKYRVEMAHRYSLKQPFYEANPFVNKIEELKKQGFTVTGVHIRRGDYKKWKGGIYYYDDKVYKKHIENISLQLVKQGNEKHMFVIFSNDVVDFEQSNNLIISNEDWYIDHHVMSLCDYLIGPPSTFTLWASYVGQVKLFHLYDNNEKIIL